MIETSLDKVVKKADCRYTLVMEVAKRARQLISGEPPLTERPSSKPVTQAIREIFEGKITYERPEGLD
ncbi:MAG: DNA-directed RNA polymerase subunit omega [Bacillota bacterium]|nr:DNA-directed RNA polymerase subunit omega [Bacillota bacterium]